MNLTVIPTLTTVPRTGTWFRATPPQFYPASVLQLAYTKRLASRFSAATASPVTYETLYLAQTPEVALLETENLYGTPGNTVANLNAVTLFDLEVQLYRLIDLTNPIILAALQTSAQELTGNWKTYGITAALRTLPMIGTIAPTQELGAALFVAGVEGFITPSAKHISAKSLVIFPENLQSGSFVQHTDPATGQIYRI